MDITSLDTQGRFTKKVNYLAFGGRMFSLESGGVRYTHWPAAQMHREIAVNEYLRRYPHPNVCTYYGVNISPNGQIEAGIFHLHSLGFVHCDIKPSNIFVDLTCRPTRYIIGDFDSTHRHGERLHIKLGTRGWTNPNFTHANWENDFFGLDKIRLWLEYKGFGIPQPGMRYLHTDAILGTAE